MRQGDPEGEDSGAGERAEPAEVPLGLQMETAVVGAVPPEGEESDDEAEGVEGFEAAGEGVGEQGGGEDGEEGEEVGSGEVAVVEGCRGGCVGRVAMQWVAAEPGQVLGGEEEGESDGVEENPAGFGVEALEGHGGVAGVADGDEGGDADDVQEPGDAECDGNEEQSSFEAEFAAGDDEPAEGEDEHEGEAFDA